MALLDAGGAVHDKQSHIEAMAGMFVWNRQLQTGG